jgi:hypothetical protein
MSVIADIRYNRVNGYSRKCTTGYKSYRRNELSHSQCDYIKGFYMASIFLNQIIF